MIKDKKLPSSVPVRKGKRWWLILATIFLILVLIFTGSFISFQYVYAQKILPNVKIGQLNVGGQTKEQTLQQLETIEKNIAEKGIIFKTQDKEIAINPIIISAENPDLALPYLDFDWQKTVGESYALGHSANIWQNLVDQIQILITGTKIKPSYTLDQNELVKNLKENFSSLEKPPVNAGIKIVNDNIEITGEQSGYVFDYQKATDQVINNLNNLKLGKINIALIFTNPEIKKNDTATAVKDVQDFLNTEKITLTFEDKKWEIKKEDLINWLEFQRDEQSRQVKIGFNKDKVLESLKPITTEINVEAKDARFQLANGRVTEFQASQDGQAVNLDESYQKINTLVFASSTKPIELVIDKTQAQIGAGDLNDLGVKELIGRGTSNFAGSPKNRRFNIALGAKTLNGILIAPDEEFSLLKALGPVDGEHGYKQELVIKGDRTKPEFGGGLCQIGTTTFRAALNTGLPITERRNHSYRVVYYEPAGMDATIYDPKPDLKFINDTGRHILFTTKISGDNLIFEFYGTKDGRTAVISPNPPRIYNVTSPGPAKNIETEDLKPGEKKQQEKPHKGADTYFKYTVTYPNGEVKEKEFTSHYVAWPEIWLVGKEPTTPSSTEPTIPTGTETETPTPTPVPAEPPAPATP